MSSVDSSIAATAQSVAGAVAPGPNPELRRVLANIRMIIAIVAAIESFALSLDTRPTLVLATLSFAAYAGWLCWVEISGNRPAQPRLIAWMDALWILLFVWLAGSPGGLFVILLLFPVLFAALSFGFASGVAVSLFVAAGALLMLQARHAGVPSGETLLVPLSIFALGPLVAGLARAGVQMSDQISLADELLARADPRQGVERVAGVLLRALGQRLEADLALLLIWLPGGEPRLFRGNRDGTMAEIPGDLKSELIAAMEKVPRSVATTHHAAQVLGRTVHLHAGFDTASLGATAVARPAVEALGTLLDAKSLVMVPICHRAPRPNWLLLETRRRRYRSRDAELLLRLMEQLAPVIENAGLLEQLCAEAAATERARIGRDLHDTAIQPYLGIKYGIDALARSAGADNPLRKPVLELQEMAASELHTLRETISGMRSGSGPTEDALEPSLRRQARRFAELFGIDVEVTCEGTLQMSRRLAATLFFLVNEALTNVRRHTRATYADILLAGSEDRFTLRVRNDHGPDAAPPPPFVPASITERAESVGGCAVVNLDEPGFTDLIISIPRPH